MKQGARERPDRAPCGEACLYAEVANNGKGTSWPFGDTNLPDPGSPLRRDCVLVVCSSCDYSRRATRRHCEEFPLDVIYESMNSDITRSTLNETPIDSPRWRRLLGRLALIPVVAIFNFATNLFAVIMTAEHRPPNRPAPAAAPHVLGERDTGDRVGDPEHSRAAT